MSRKDLRPFSAMAAANGIKPATFYNRVYRGWEPIRAAMTAPRGYFYDWPRQ
jgi:hypothetical protein